jgi:hypothetical protein
MPEKELSRRILWPALAAGLLLVTASIVIGRHVASEGIGAAFIWGLGGVLLIATVLFVAPRRGMGLLWIGAGALWLAVLAYELNSAGATSEAARNIPYLFVAWSQLMLPLAVATMLYARMARMVTAAQRNRTRAVLSLAWVSLVAGAWYLSSFAIDVGGSPLQNDAIVVISGVALIPTPIALALWFALPFIRGGQMEG